MQTYVVFTAVFFVIIGGLHLLRAFLGWSVTIHRYSVPRTFSFLAGLAACLLAAWAFALL